MALMPADMVALRVEGVNWNRVLNLPISLSEAEGRCCLKRKSREQKKKSAGSRMCRA
jgi:hypothetical protein